MKKCEENMKKYEGNVRLRRIPDLPAGAGKSYAKFLGWPTVPKGKAGLPPKFEGAPLSHETCQYYFIFWDSYAFHFLVFSNYCYIISEYERLTREKNNSIMA